MPPAGQPSSEQARPIHGILQDDSKTVSFFHFDPIDFFSIVKKFFQLLDDRLQDIERVSSLARARKDFLIRHHLDRTTGVGERNFKQRLIV